MGVKGLWKLLDGTGRPVHLESLEGKVLAVDISVWLNMAIKGMRDYHGHSSATAHLTTLFNRICKLLYYGVKPVFVFDGQPPALKQKTLRERRERKNFNVKESKKASEKILQNYLKMQILQETVGKSSQEDNPGTSKSSDEPTATLKTPKVTSQEKDIYDLPPLASQLNDSDQDELEEELKMRTELQSEYLDDGGHVDIASILNMDVDSKDFASLPSDVQYELLKDLREVRKRRRTRLEAMPEESNSFSDYQISGLLAKRKISKKMEFVENKMSKENVAASSSLSGLTDDIAKDHIVDARQLVSDSTSHYIWLRKINGKNEKKNDEPEASEMPSYTNLSVIQEEPLLNEEEPLLNGRKTTVQDSIRVKPTSPISENPTTSKQLEQYNQNSAIIDLTECEPGHSTSEESEITLVQSNKDFEVNQVEGTFQLDKNSNLKVSQVHAPRNVHPADKDDIIHDSLHNPTDSKHAYGTSSTSNETTVTEVECSSMAVSSNSFDSCGQIATDKVQSEGVTKFSTDKKFLSEIQTEKSSHIYKEHEEITVLLPETSIPNTSSSSSTVLIRSSKVDMQAKKQASDSSDEDFMDVPEQSYRNSMDRKEQTNQDNAEPENEIIAEEKSEEEPSDYVESNPWEGLSSDNLENFASQLDEQSKELHKLMKAKERAAKDLSESAQMECQELLKLFGLPYIVSPQEAEAQCAALELLGLTHGTITEDSDIWLFGGRFVIKDMFGNNRDPLSFSLPDIQMQLGLGRERFICVALCSGSDYTTGIHGVGPVTAMEILREFEGDGIDGLVSLRKWWDDAHASAKEITPTETKIKSQLRRINLRRDFPSQAVYKAYMKPVVDETDKKFEWGYPDLDDLRIFATGTMGWTKQKVDEVLLPVMMKLGQRRAAQTKITQYLPTVSHNPTNKKRSKRVMRAAAILTGKVDTVPQKKTRRIAKSTKKLAPKKEQKVNLSESSSDED